MEGDQPIGDKAQYKPPGYKQLQYNPSVKLASEGDLKNIEQKKLEKAYSLWVMIREQMF